MPEAHFDWDDAKDASNQRKHGGSFTAAQHAFADHRRVIAKDVGHSGDEERFYCFGRWRSDGPFHLSRYRHSHHRRRLLAQRKGNP